MVRRARVDPMPPRVGGRLPFVRGGLDFIRSPTAFLIDARARVGDTFLLDAFGFELLCTFAPIGLRSLYAAPENAASFTEATRTLIGFKLPAELLAGDMQLFRKLFGREQMPGYLAHIRAAVRDDVAALGPSGEFELFDHAKRLVHRIGFRTWVGELGHAQLERLQAAFERLDPEAAFVRPRSIFWTLATRKSSERRALREVEAVLHELWTERQRSGQRHGDMLESLHAQHSARLQDPSLVLRAVANDVMILHLASLTNLYAALAWTLVNLLLRPTLLARARLECDHLAKRASIELADLAALETLDACAHESIRVAQRSITLRKILEPCELDVGERVYTLQPGLMLATMLSVTNGEYGDLDRFDIAHYQRGRLAPDIELPTREVVSTFGHGAHACPGQRFAIALIKLVVVGYLDALALEPLFAQAAPPPEQIGAVARAAQPCRVRYRGC